MRRNLLLILMMLLPLMASAYEAEIDGICYDFIENEATVIYNSNKYTGDVVIPASVTYNNQTYSVTRIEDYAFYGCSGLTSVIIGNNVTSIGKQTFEGCKSMTSVTFGNSVTTIGSAAFNGCSGLTSITIPKSVTDIAENAFNSCKSLTSVTIPKSVTRIGVYAFSGCSGLTSIKVEAENTKYDSRNDCNAIIETDNNTLIRGCENTVIPNSVISISEGAFSRCSGLTSIAIPNSVTSIGKSAFSGCSGLTSITIPDEVTDIGVQAFCDCSGLTSISIHNRVTSIGVGAFAGCSGLISIKVEEGNANYDSRNDCNAIIETASNTLITGCQNTVIPNSITSIGNDAFEDCVGLTSFTIPNSVINIGSYAFEGCSGLTSFTIPNSVINIGNFAFEGCSGLTSVTIGNSVTSIGSYAFYLGAGLTDVYCFAENVPNTQSNNFPKNASATLHVPASAIELYKATAPWSDFGNIVPLTEEEVDGIEGPTPSPSLVERGAWFDLNGRRVQQPRNGIFIKNGKKILMQ